MRPIVSVGNENGMSSFWRMEIVGGGLYQSTILASTIHTNHLAVNTFLTTISIVNLKKSYQQIAVHALHSPSGPQTHHLLGKPIPIILSYPRYCLDPNSIRWINANWRGGITVCHLFEFGHSVSGSCVLVNAIAWQLRYNCTTHISIWLSHSNHAHMQAPIAQIYWNQTHIHSHIELSKRERVYTQRENILRPHW